MNVLQPCLAAIMALVLPGALHLPRGHNRAPESDSLLQGAEAALQAYTRASDAYTQSLVAPSVAFWSLVLAAGVVLLEWVVARLRHRG